MSTYNNWKVNDTINICASVADFCGTTNFIRVYAVEISLPPDNCSNLPIDINSGCGIHLNNVEITFSFVKGMDGTNCSVAQTYKTFPGVKTSSIGAAGISYTVTEQDRLNYTSATNEGYSFYVMACITNSDGQVVTTNISEVSSSITINESHLKCVDGVCTRVIGIGTDTCTNEGSTSECGLYTHNLDLIVQPWSWYTPSGATDAITQKIIDINGSITNFFANYGIIDYTYVGTEIFTENDKVVIRIKLNKINTVTMGVPLLAQIVVLIASILFVISFIGRISSYVFGDNNIALTNEDLTSAGQEFTKNTMDGIVEACSNPTYTQDQKATCIKDQTDNLLKNWKEYQTDIYPDADHTALDNGLTEIQLCYDTYNSSSKTSTDYQTLLDCTKTKREEAIDKDKDNTLETYDPDATAGEKESPSDLGKILLYGGVGLAGLYVLTRKK